MFKAIDKWLPGYLKSLFCRPVSYSGTRHLIVCVCDHYEPFRDGTDVDTARKTVSDWLAAYPAIADSFRDADGLPPRHTFFYPQEEYDATILDNLATFCRRGYGEVEIHLHHRHDTPEGFRKKLETFRDLLHQRHGLLGCQVDKLSSQSPSGQSLTTQQPNNLATAPSCASGAVRYAFIHGNWSLCNSRPDGDWCGVNEELGILADTGCYADFTFPSAPSPTQPKMVNAIYYAQDTPGQPRGADRGKLLSCQVAELLPAERTEQHNNTTTGRDSATTQQHNNLTTDRLLLITGPLALNWARRKWGVVPRLENADISGANPPTSDRIRLWARQHIGVAGRPDWVFVKLHTHGCVPANAKVVLGEPMRAMHEALQREYNDGRRWQLHYVTAREMHNLVKAAEANLPGPPGQYRDTPISWEKTSPLIFTDSR